MSNNLPGLRFGLFGFPVFVGADFFLISVILGLSARSGIYLVEWVLVLAVSILVHELGHAFVLRSYNVNPEIRLWGMGGLTISGFALPPRKSLFVSLAGPAIGIPIALAIMVVQPWIPANNEPLRILTTDLIFINLWWGLLNLLPIAGLDGGNSVMSLAVMARGEGARRAASIFVAICSIAIAIGAVAIGFLYLAIVIAFFALFNPEGYVALWGLLTGGGRSAGAPSRGSYAPAPKPARPVVVKREEKRNKERSVAVVAAEARRPFGETYVETVPGAAAEVADDREGFLDELESRPAPLLPDVTGMISRRDDPAVATRLAAEDDPLAVLVIVTRVIEAKRVSQLLSTLRRGETPDAPAALAKLQVALHSLGKFEDSLAAASILGRSGGSMGAVLEARSAARIGDKKRTGAALERAAALGDATLSEAALGDIVRIGPDAHVSDQLNRLRGARRG